MGRKSPFGYRFLVRRDNGRFLYSRELNAGVVPFLSGTILTPWDHGVRKLGGGSVIKIALDTTDLEVARERWGTVHEQVRRLVEAAEAVARPKAKAALEPRRVSGPSADQITLMADQERYSILARHDAELERFHVDESRGGFP